jgi:hypothetical protein
MIAGKTILAGFLIGGVSLTAAPALACGGTAMALPVGMPMVGHAMPMALPAIGMTVGVLPPGFISVTVSGAAFFRAGPTWYAQFQGPTGPMFRVVPAPHGM